MKREDIKKYFPDATEEQMKELLDINSADIGKAKGDAKKLEEDLAAARESLKSYETTVADLKKAAEGNEDFKKKFEDLEKKIADEKAEAERKAAEAAAEADLKARFDGIVGQNKWRDELTGNAVFGEFKKALADETNKGKGDKEIFESLTKDKNYYANPNPPGDMGGFGGAGGGTPDDNSIRAIMGLPPIK